MITAEEILAASVPRKYKEARHIKLSCGHPWCNNERHMTSGGYLKGYCRECEAQRNREWRASRKK